MLFIFLLLVFKSSLYVLDNSPLSDMSFTNIFSQSVICLLILFLPIFKLGCLLSCYFLKELFLCSGYKLFIKYMIFKMFSHCVAYLSFS